MLPVADDKFQNLNTFDHCHFPLATLSSDQNGNQGPLNKGVKRTKNLTLVIREGVGSQ